MASITLASGKSLQNTIPFKVQETRRLLASAVSLVLDPCLMLFTCRVLIKHNKSSVWQFLKTAASSPNSERLQLCHLARGRKTSKNNLSTLDSPFIWLRKQSLSHTVLLTLWPESGLLSNSSNLFYTVEMTKAPSVSFPS